MKIKYWYKQYIEKYNRKHPDGIGRKYVKINKIDE